MAFTQNMSLHNLRYEYLKVTNFGILYNQKKEGLMQTLELTYIPLFSN